MLTALEPLIGTWRVTAEFPRFPELGSTTGMTTVEWLLGGAFVLQRSTVEIAEAPDGHIIIAAAPDRPGHFVQHYFDSRGVVRVLEMTFDGRTWTLLRTKPDFTSLEFSQRFLGTLSEDGRVIEGQFEIAQDHTTWELDIPIRYERA